MQENEKRWMPENKLSEADNSKKDCVWKKCPIIKKFYTGDLQDYCSAE